MLARICFLIIVFLFNKASALTLEEVMKQSRKRSDEAFRIKALSAAADAEVVSSFTSNFLPEFSYFFEKTNYNNEKVFSGIPSTSLDSQRQGLEAKYELSNLYKGSFNFLARKSAANSEIFRQKDAQNAFMLEIIRMYFSILEMQKKIELYKQSLKVNTNLYETMSGAASRGSAKRSASLIVFSQIEELKANIALTESELQTAKSRFFSKTGLHGEDLKEPALPLLSFETLDEVLEKAKKYNSALGASKKIKDVIKYQAAYAGAAFLPDVTLAYRNFEELNSFQNYRQNMLYLGVKFYFYRPGMISDVIKKGYEYRASNYEYAIIYKELENKIRDLWARRQYYLSVFSVKKKIVEVRRQIFTDLKEDNKRGRIEINLLLDEERKLIESEEDFLKIRLNSILNIFEIRSISGIDL